MTHHIQSCRKCKTEVYDEISKTWIVKDKKERSLICYFPNNWTKQNTVTYLQGMYNHECFQNILSRNSGDVKSLKICFKANDLLGTRWNVWFYLGERPDKTNKNRPIDTAFLAERGKDDGCNAAITCTKGSQAERKEEYKNTGGNF